jgi:signal transduction histidine kinase
VRHAIPLGHGDDQLGEVVIGLRPGESQLDLADERILALLAAPLAVAVHATTLSAQLRQSRERLISAREEERRRLRRDLHDGLGPALTGVGLKADAARRLAATDPDRTAQLLAELREQTTAAIDEIRRLVYGLRPPALESLGLLGAVREQATTLSERVDGGSLLVTVEAPAALAELPAAVEVAAYRIVTEALTNVTRHSTASAATVTITADQRALHLRIRDNGGNGGGPWQPGVGLTSMRERAAELGGVCEAADDHGGGQVTVTIPLGVT